MIVLISVSDFTELAMVNNIPSKNTLGVKKGEAKSEAPVNIKITESTGD